MKNETFPKINKKKIHVCPRCLNYYRESGRTCPRCKCNKCYTSVLRNQPSSLSQIPKEDWDRIISYKKLNGYSYAKYIPFYHTAPLLGVKIPKDDKPSYIMKGLAKPKNQRGGFGGIANHSGISGQVRTINSGTCIPK